MADEIISPETLAQDEPVVVSPAAIDENVIAETPLAADLPQQQEQLPDQQDPVPDKNAMSYQIWLMMKDGAGIKSSYKDFMKNMQDVKEVDALHDLLQQEAGWKQPVDEFRKIFEKKSDGGSTAKPAGGTSPLDSAGVKGAGKDSLTGKAKNAGVAVDGASAPAPITDAENIGIKKDMPWSSLSPQQHQYFEQMGGYLRPLEEQEQLVQQLQRDYPVDLLKEGLSTETGGPADMLSVPTGKVIDNPVQFLNKRQLNELKAKGFDVLSPEIRNQEALNILRRPVTQEEEIQDNIGEMNDMLGFLSSNATFENNDEQLAAKVNGIKEAHLRKDPLSQTIDIFAGVQAPDVAPDSDATGVALSPQQIAVAQTKDAPPPPIMTTIKEALARKDWGQLSEINNAVFQNTYDMLSYMPGNTLWDVAANKGTPVDAGKMYDWKGDLKEQYVSGDLAKRNLKEAHDKTQRTLDELGYPSYDRDTPIMKAATHIEFSVGADSRSLQEQIDHPIEEGAVNPYEKKVKMLDILNEDQVGALMYLRDYNKQTYSDYMKLIQKAVQINPATGNPYYQEYMLDQSANDLYTNVMYDLSRKGRDIHIYNTNTQAQQQLQLVQGPLAKDYNEATFARANAMRDGTYYANKEALDAKVTATQTAYNNGIDKLTDLNKATEDAAQSLFDKYPDKVQRDNEAAFRDLSGDDNKWYGQRFAEGVAKVLDVPKELWYMMTPSSPERRVQESVDFENKQVYEHIPQNKQFKIGDYNVSLAPEHQANINAILSSDGDYYNKLERYTKYVEANPGAIVTQINPDAGGYRLTSVPAVANEMSEGLAQLSKVYLINTLTEGMGATLVKGSQAAIGANEALTSFAAGATAKEGFAVLQKTVADLAAQRRISTSLADALNASIEYQASVTPAEAGWKSVISNFMEKNVPNALRQHSKAAGAFAAEAYNDGHAEVISRGGSEDEANKFGLQMGAIQGLGVYFTPDVQGLGKALGFVKPVTNGVSNATIKALTGEEISAGYKFLEKTGNLGKIYAKKYFEFTAPLTFQNVTGAIASDAARKNSDPNYTSTFNLYDSFRDGIVTGAVQFWAIPIPGTYVEWLQSNRLNRDALYVSAISPNQAKSTIDNMVAKNEMTYADGESKKQLINTAVKEYNSLPKRYDGKALSETEKSDYIAKRVQLIELQKQQDALNKPGTTMNPDQQKQFDKLKAQSEGIRSDLYKILNGDWVLMGNRLKRSVGYNPLGSTDYDRVRPGNEPVINVKQDQKIKMPDGTEMTVSSVGSNHVELRGDGENPADVVQFNSAEDFNKNFVEPNFKDKQEFTDLNPTVHSTTIARPEGYTAPVSEGNPLSVMSVAGGQRPGTRVPLADVASELASEDPTTQGIVDWGLKQKTPDGKGIEIQYKALTPEDGPVVYNKLTGDIIINTENSTAREMSRETAKDLVTDALSRARKDAADKASPVRQELASRDAEQLKSELGKINTGKMTPQERQDIEGLRSMSPEDIVHAAVTNPKAREVLSKVEVQTTGNKEEGVMAAEEARHILNSYSNPDNPNLAGDVPTTFTLESEPIETTPRPTRQPGESIPDYSRRVKQWNGEQEAKRQQAAYDKRQQEIASGETSDFQRNMKTDAKLLDDSNGNMDYEELNKQRGYEQKDVQPFINAAKNILADPDVVDFVKQRIRQQVERMRSNPFTAAPTRAAEINAEKLAFKSYFEGYRSAFRKTKAESKQAARQLRRELYDRQQRRLKEQKEKYNQKLDDANTKFKGKAEALRQRRAEIEEENRLAKQKIRADHKEAMAKQAAKFAETLGKERQARTDLTTRQDLYRQRVTNLLDEYQKAGLLKGGKFSQSDLSTMVREAMRNMDEESFDRVKNLLHSLAEKTDFQKTKKRIEDASKSLRKLLTNDVLPVTDKRVLKELLQYGPYDVANPNELADVMEKAVKDREAFDYNKRLPLTNERLTNFLAVERRVKMAQLGHDLVADYGDMMNSNIYNKLQENGKLDNFPTKDEYRDRINKILADETTSREEKEKALTEEKRKLTRLEEHGYKLAADNKSTGPLDYLGDNKRNKGNMKSDSDVGATKAAYNELLNDPHFKDINDKGLAANFPDYETFSKTLDAATPEQQKNMGRNVRDIQGQLTDYKNNKNGTDNINDIESVDFDKSERYKKADKRPEKFKQRYADLMNSDYMQAMQKHGMLDNFPTQKEFDDGVEFIKDDPKTIRLFGKRLRLLEEHVKNLAENTDPENMAADILNGDRINFHEPVTFGQDKDLLERTKDNQAMIDLKDDTLTDEQRKALTTLKEFDLDNPNLTDENLKLYNNVLRNMAHNGGDAGLGIIEAIHEGLSGKKRKEFDNLIQSGYRVPDVSFHGKLGEYWENIISTDNAASRLFASPKLLAKAMGASNWEQIRNGFVKATREVHDNYDKPLSDLLTKYKIRKNDAETNMRMAIVGWIRQHQGGTAADQATEITKRIEEVADDIGQKKTGNKESRKEAELEEKVFDNIIDKLNKHYKVTIVKKTDDGRIIVDRAALSGVSAEGIFEAGVLPEGEQKVLQHLIDNYEKIKPRWIETQRKYNNKDITDTFQNYVKDPFKLMDKEYRRDDFSGISEGEYNMDNDSLNFLEDNPSTRLRAKGNRLAQKDALDAEKGIKSKHVINTDFFNVQERNLKGMYNDVHNLPNLKQADAVFNDPSFIRDVGGTGNAALFKEAMLREARYMAGRSPEKAVAIDRILKPLIDTVRKVGSMQQLSGVMQYLQQAASQNFNMIGDLALKGYGRLPFIIEGVRRNDAGAKEAMDKLIEQHLISLREELVGGTRSHPDPIRKMVGIDGKFDKAREKLKDLINRTDKYTGEEKNGLLGLLQKGDYKAAKEAWINNYAMYLLKEGKYPDAQQIDWAKEAAHPDADAAAYAQNVVANLQNVNSQASVSAFQSSPNNQIAKALFGMFASFNLNKTTQWNEGIRALIQSRKIENPEQRKEMVGQAWARLGGLLSEDVMYGATVKPLTRMLTKLGAAGFLNAIGATQGIDKDKTQVGKIATKENYLKSIYSALINSAVQNVAGGYFNVGPQALQDLANKPFEISGHEQPFYSPNEPDHGAFTAAYDNWGKTILRLGQLMAHYDKTNYKDWTIASAALVSQVLASRGWNEATIKRMVDQAAKDWDLNLEKRLKLDQDLNVQGKKNKKK